MISAVQRRFGAILTIAFGFAFISPAIRAVGHEGHAALPSKGTQVDLQQGTVFLSREAREALSTKTAEVELRPIEKTAIAYAKLASPWTKHAFATSRIGGRIEKLLVKPGQSVKAGQPLAEVRSLELDNLQLELLNAENELALSKKMVKQRAELVREGALAGRELLEANTKNIQNESAVKIARLKLQGLGWSIAELDKLVGAEPNATSPSLTITSPIAGVVTHADLTIGKVVEPNEHLFEIVDLSSVWVQLGVLEKDIQRVAAGQSVELKLAAFPDETFTFRVQAKGLGLDPQTRMGAAWGELANAELAAPKFVPGMNGQARIVVYSPGKRVAVPTSAVVGEGSEWFVLVEEEATEKGSQFRKRNVVIDAVTPQWVFLKEGNVFPGDRVLTQGAQILASYFIAGVLRPSEEAKKNIGLRLEPAGSRPIEEILEFDGVVNVPPDQRAMVSSQLAGTLERINIERGQTVRAGDVLAELSSLEFQNLQLEMLQADQQARLLTDQREQLAKLTDGTVARRRLWELDNALTAAVLKRDSMRRKLEGIGLDNIQIEAILSEAQLLPRLPLRAPIDGAVVHFDKALGQAIKAEEPMFEIHDLSHVWVEGFLSERHLSQVHIDAANPQLARVRLLADPNAVASGKVVRSGRTLGKENRSMSVWIELDRPPSDPWQHNMLTSVTLASGRAATVLAVPRDAVTWEGTRAFLFVQRPDGILERRAVETGRTDDRYIEIVRGLKATESVAVSGAADLQTAYSVLR